MARSKISLDAANAKMRKKFQLDQPMVLERMSAAGGWVPSMPSGFQKRTTSALLAIIEDPEAHPRDVIAAASVLVKMTQSDVLHLKATAHVLDQSQMAERLSRLEEMLLRRSEVQRPVVLDVPIRGSK